jgi:hypothetical protein
MTSVHSSYWKGFTIVGVSGISVNDLQEFSLDGCYKAQSTVPNDDYNQAVADADGTGCENAVLIYLSKGTGVSFLMKDLGLSV